MRRLGSLFAVFLCLGSLPLLARHSVGGSCGTSRENSEGRLFLHRQATRGRVRPLALAAAPAAVDYGNIAVIDDSGGVVSRQNQFSLGGMTLAFQPSGDKASHYRFSLSSEGYESAAASAGAPLVALDDDDSRAVALPFAFPFFGAVYTQVFVNSDGNLTFIAGDSASADRSVGRMAAGQPRISPLFDDLNPAQTAGGVRVLAGSNRVVVSWVAVPEYSDAGVGLQATFQVKLYSDGRIEFSYPDTGVSTGIQSAVVGIAPGSVKGATSMVDFRNDASGDYSSAVVEWFAGGQSVDMVAVAQKFYQTHEDAYDYLVVYNNMGIPAMGQGVIAFEDTVRSQGAGFGMGQVDYGQQYGSASRLQSAINMGPLSQYEPPGGPPTPRPGDTPLSILAHESGHLFLAFASITDPETGAQPMLGYGGSHWSFLFNSDASFLEGESITDRGADYSPNRFITGATVQHYSLLDQYLMGFRKPGDVKDTFVVRSPVPSYISPLWHPPAQIWRFDGTRQNITVNDVIAAVGRRTPDYAVAQRRFRWGFILLVQQGTQPPADVLAKLESYRQQFPAYYAAASDGNGTAETTLGRSMKLSFFPAAGIATGSSATATLTVETPPAADLAVRLQAPNGNASAPVSITIPAGANSASFTVAGLKDGVEELTAAPPTDSGYETAFARVQVQAAGLLKLAVVSGDHQITSSAGALADPIVVRLTDANNLPYPGATIQATASAGGSVSGASATDAQGQASFRWTPGPAATSVLRLELKGGPAVTINGGSAAPVVTSITNGASFVPGIAAGAFATVWGVNLADGQASAAPSPWPKDFNGLSVQLNGVALPLLYTSDTQINIYVPPGAALGDGTLSVVTPSGARASSAVNVAAIQPGIFPRAIVRNGTNDLADTVAVEAGDYLQIYCTGLGPTYQSGNYQMTVHTPTVFIGASPAAVVYSGASGYTGVYQVNVQVPAGLAAGRQPVMLSVNELHSNAVDILVK